MPESMDIDRDVTAFLQKSRASAPAELKDDFVKFEELYDKKLWHQLTLALEKFVTKPAAAPFLVPLYEEFISDWSKKMNQLSLVQYATKASRTIKDPSKALEFLTALADRLKDKPDHLDAHILSTMEAAHIKLLLKDLEGCKSDIEKSEKLLEKITSIEPVINASFYRVSADYYKAKAAYPQFYHNALLFLSSVTLEELGAAEKVERAYDLALSALLGEGVYNFGELLLHPILDTLKGSPADWLRQLLYAFNSGDFATFEKVSKTPAFLSTPLLANSLDFLNQKLCLMSLIETVFRRSKEERGSLSFAQISKDTRVPIEEVEHLVMKALSLGLLKGSIDEVEKKVNVTWVQPRVLSMDQISSLKTRLDEWLGTIKNNVLPLMMEHSHGVAVVEAQ
ncbi:26S proteasome regulatory subunit [Chytridiales sp. JEL 0842]|nr:26S proteasome regulatory subunit [Chytridiales sp. JEL 0842]